MQRIVSLLVFQSPKPLALMDVSIWPDSRMRPIGDVMEKLEAQTHRRFMKAHLPFNALPIHDQVRYISVGRDGRDAALSFHNHASRFSSDMLERLDAIGLEDETLGRPFPRMPEDPAAHFHRWMTEGTGPDADNGLPLPSFFDFQQSWWNARHRDNVLLVHYADLKADLDGEMRRVAEFLGIETPDDLWPQLVAAATFHSMKKEGAGILGQKGALAFTDGGKNFLHKGTNGRWRDLFNADDLVLYDAAMAQLPVDCAKWIAEGNLAQSKS